MVAPAPPGIGGKLRRARIDRSLSIEETAWRTRIRPDLLRALELEDFESIGHQSFVRTHLSSYARFLGMDPSAVVEEFDSRSDEPVASSIEELDRQVQAARKPPRPKWLIAAALSGAVLALAAIGGVLGGQAERPTEAPSTTMPGLAESASSGIVPAAEARVRLRVEALAEAHVSVEADGSQIFEGTLEAGSARSFRARSEIEVLAADAGTIALRLNGDDLGTAGDSGELFRARFGPRGQLDD